MKTAKFSVQAKALGRFSDFVADHELENQILGTDRSGRVVVEVHYATSERETIDILRDVIEREEAIQTYFLKNSESSVVKPKDDWDDDDDEDDEDDDEDEDEDEDDED